MSTEAFEFVKEFPCSCGKMHSTQVDDVIVEKGAINRIPEVIARYHAKKAFVLADENTYKAAGEKVCSILEENGWPTLPDCPPEQRVLAYEDVYPMLYLKQRLLTTKQHRNIRHLIIDEMQDYSYLQYVILDSMFSCKMTILGDRAQTMDDKPQDVLQFLPKKNL